MDFDTILIAALQSSFLLGLIHGINPCGHSWLVLAPFVTGEKNGRTVAILTTSFLLGTGIACVVLGATLGGVSSLLPDFAGYYVEIATSIVLILLGAVLIYDPHILHKHNHDEHDHKHDHSHDKEHHHHSASHSCNHSCGHHSKSNTNLTKKGKWLAASLFSIGFVNMIIPCPTAAVMYGYALNSGSSLTATLVFGVYAISTAISVSAVIFVIYKMNNMAGKLQKEWLEPLIMRTAGAIIILFSSYTLFSAITQ